MQEDVGSSKTGFPKMQPKMWIRTNGFNQVHAEAAVVEFLIGREVLIPTEIGKVLSQISGFGAKPAHRKTIVSTKVTNVAIGWFMAVKFGLVAISCDMCAHGFFVVFGFVVPSARL